MYNHNNLVKNIYPPKKGDIYTTSTEIEMVVKGGVKVIPSEPMSVVLEDDGMLMPWGDLVYRCMVVEKGIDPISPGDAVMLDESRVWWTVRTWLSFPISADQLWEPEGKFEELKFPPPYPEDMFDYPELYDRREEILDRASRLPVMCDSRACAARAWQSMEGASADNVNAVPTAALHVYRM